VIFSRTVGISASQKGIEQNGDCTSPSVSHDISGTNDPFPAEHTVTNLIQWASKALLASGIDSHRLDAEILLAHLTGCKRIDLYIQPEKPIEHTIAENYKKAVRERMRRVPLQYITNHAEFLSLDFYVDKRVLIPRPETELLVEAVIEKSRALSQEHEITIVDIGTGSGNIAITLAKNIHNAKIYAIDLSPDALSVAKINAQKHHILDKIVFLCGDAFKPLEGLGLEGQIHFVISNPPYVSSKEFDTLQEEIRHFEPYTALISGEDGLLMFRRIIADAGKWLKPCGFIVFEVGEKQARKVARLLESTHSFKKAVLIRDYQHIFRIVIAQREENA